MGFKDIISVNKLNIPSNRKDTKGEVKRFKGIQMD